MHTHFRHGHNRRRARNDVPRHNVRTSRQVARVRRVIRIRRHNRVPLALRDRVEMEVEVRHVVDAHRRVSARIPIQFDELIGSGTLLRQWQHERMLASVGQPVQRLFIERHTKFYRRVSRLRVEYDVRPRFAVPQLRRIALLPVHAGFVVSGTAKRCTRRR